MRALEARFCENRAWVLWVMRLCESRSFQGLRKINGPKGLSLRFKSECLGGRHDLAWVAIFEFRDGDTPF